MQLIFTQMGGTAVMPALGRAIGREMLDGRDDRIVRVLLHALYDCDTQFTRQERILAKALFHARPSGVFGQVDNRAITDMPSLFTNLSCLGGT